MQLGKALALVSLACPGTLAAPAEEIPKIEQKGDQTQALPPQNPPIYDWREEPWSHYAMADNLDRMYPVGMKQGTFSMTLRARIFFDFFDFGYFLNLSQEMCGCVK